MFCIHDGHEMKPLTDFRDSDATAFTCPNCTRIQVETRDLLGRPHILLFGSLLELAGQFPNQFQRNLFQ